MQPREQVQVEAGDAHDRVVCVLLIRHHELGHGVPGKGKVVVARVNGLEEAWACGKEGDVLDVGVVLLEPMLVGTCRR